MQALIGEAHVCASIDPMAEWVKREYGKSYIDRIGALCVPWWKNDGPYVFPPPGLGEAYHIIQNWRTCHAMPLLTFRMGLTKRAERVDPKSIIAQRMKRFASVMNKLVREPDMKLSQMQDLGGCRAIVANVEAVYRIYDLYRGSGDLFESEGGLKCRDYILDPKVDGYRGIHIVGRYRAVKQANEPWNGQRIEVQLRSQLQHSFATTVETVTTFTRYPLKFGGGPQEWRRFFSLMGSAIAAREQTPLVSGTPENHDELVRELREHTKALRVRQRLRAWTRALKELPRSYTRDAKWLLLVLDVAKDTIKVVGYSDGRKASKAVAEIEKSQPATQLDAVLVWVDSARELRKAYPNYYADTRAFLEALTMALKVVKE